MVELGTHRTNRKGALIGNSPPTAARAAFLSRLRGVLGDRRSYRDFTDETSNDINMMAGIDVGTVYRTAK